MCKDGRQGKMESFNELFPFKVEAISRSLKELSKVLIVLVPFSRIFVLKIYCNFLSKYPSQSLFLVKYHALNLSFWTPLDGCVCIIKIIL